MNEPNDYMEHSREAHRQALWPHVHVASAQEAKTFRERGTKIEYNEPEGTIIAWRLGDKILVEQVTTTPCTVIDELRMPSMTIYETKHEHLAKLVRDDLPIRKNGKSHTIGAIGVGTLRFKLESGTGPTYNDTPE